MPWETPSTVEARNAFIDAWLEKEESLTDLCSRFQISRKTGYKWLERYDQEGRAGLVDRSRAPKSCPHATTPEMSELLVDAKRAHPKWGPRKLKAYLEREYSDLKLPAASTIGRVLKERGLVVPQKVRRRTPLYDRDLLPYDQPNGVWCADFKGPVRLRHKKHCHPLTITDGYSRYLLRCHIVDELTLEGVRPVFESAFRQFGLPRAIRTDNGTPFASLAPAGLSRLSIWWMKLGITPERIVPGKPQQNGRHERMHRTLKDEACGLPRVTRREQQRRFDRFIREYNELRPHEGLGNLTPSDIYAQSAVRYPRHLPPYEYPPDVTVRRVRSSGEVKWAGNIFHLSETLRGELVGFTPNPDLTTWTIQFRGVRLGQLTDDNRFVRIEPPRRPRRLSPMSPV